MKSPYFDGKTILVTGASGFIGSHISQKLCELGSEVHAISRVECPVEMDRRKWWVCDLTDMEMVRSLMMRIKPGIIFHLASYVTGAQGLDYVIPTFHNNLTSHVNLLVAASEIGCERVVSLGSDREPKLGDPHLAAFSPYAAAKWSASIYGRMFYSLYQLPIVNLRVHMTYGPAQKDLKKLVPYVISCLFRGETPKLTSGQLQADWIYVSDVMESLLAVAQAPHVEGSTIDVGTGTLTSVRTVVEHLVEMIDPSIEPVFGAKSDRLLEPVRVADTEDTFSRIGWKARVPLLDGLKQTVSWYAQQLGHVNNA